MNAKYLPKGVAGPVFEIKPSQLVTKKNVARSEVQIPFDEDVGQYLFLGGLGVSVPLEVFDRVTSNYFTHEFSRFTRFTGYAEPSLCIP